MQKTNERVIIAYRKEFQQEKSARMTGRVEVDSESKDERSRFRAFWKSCYSDDILANRIGGLLGEEQQVRFGELCDIEEDVNRKTFITDRINERGKTNNFLFSINYNSCNNLVAFVNKIVLFIFASKIYK